MNPRNIPRDPIPRNIPRDMFLGIFRGIFRGTTFLGIFRGITFLGIFRGTRSSEFSDENSEEYFVGTSEDWTIGMSIEISRRSSPSVYSEELSDELVVLGIFSEICFLGIPSENSEGFPRKNEFPRSYFRELVSSRGPKAALDQLLNPAISAHAATEGNRRG
ncbi:hypothetical protein DY000_02013867 [Brassica cretica]|uniref:Uncharacterized protein n=1 Tax=Brassica cretica TaxID=69181 RepID=A0ABQ7CMB6_BRACR|nr:hypothetical protein DY000_02013867 [Brassica cretica]